MDTRIASFASLIAIAACHKTAAAPAQPPPVVQVADVEQMDVPLYREWIATLDGFVNADIRPQVEGYVRKQAYREGTHVLRHDLLFLIDPRNYKAVADQAKATLDRNIAALEKARLDVKRDRQLFAQQTIPRQQLDNDVTAELEAAANVESARAILGSPRGAMTPCWTSSSTTAARTRTAGRWS